MTKNVASFTGNTACFQYLLGLDVLSDTPFPNPSPESPNQCFGWNPLESSPADENKNIIFTVDSTLTDMLDGYSVNYPIINLNVSDAKEVKKTNYGEPIWFEEWFVK